MDTSEVFSGTAVSGTLSEPASAGGLAGWVDVLFLAEQEWEVDDLLIYWNNDDDAAGTGRLLIKKLEPGQSFYDSDAVSLLDSGDYDFATQYATDAGASVSLSSTVGGTQGQGTAASGVTVAANLMVSDRTKLTLRRGDRLAIGWSGDLTGLSEFVITPVLRNMTDLA
jgi:hypothetical protein